MQQNSTVTKTIGIQKMGKLRIYLPPADKIRSGKRTVFRKLFPKTAYIHILEDARLAGIMNASVYNTHAGFSTLQRIETFNPEGNNARLNMCIELVDSREKLEHFFLLHQNHLKGKVVIFKEVESWTTH